MREQKAYWGYPNTSEGLYGDVHLKVAFVNMVKSAAEHISELFNIGTSSSQLKNRNYVLHIEPEKSPAEKVADFIEDSCLVWMLPHIYGEKVENSRAFIRAKNRELKVAG